MTNFRLMGALTGPAAVSAFAGSFQAGLIFYVASQVCWFQGYWWWVPANGDTASQKFALWNLKSAVGATQSLIPGSVVSSGTLTQGQWNFIPLTTPIPLSTGSAAFAGGLFCATTAWTAVNGFPDTNNQFGTGDPFANGISNGPLNTFGQTTAVPNYSAGSTFGTATNDPTVAAPIATDSTFDNFWIDVQVSNTVPVGYAGTYRLWPNRADTNSGTSVDSSLNFTLGNEFHISQSCQINKIWFYSPSGTAQLPTRASIYSILGPNAGTELISVTSPSWSGAAGTGWISTSVPGTQVIPAGQYKVTVFNGAATPDAWSDKDNVSNFWATGEGAAGITNGPLFASPVSSSHLAYKYLSTGGGNTPPFSDGLGTTEAGQNTFAQSNVAQYPYLYVDGQAQVYWVDVEVTPVASGSNFVTSTNDDNRLVKHLIMGI